MKPCYVFGPWVNVDPIPDTPGVIIANAVRWHREAPDPSARAEAWYWTGDPGEPSIPGEDRGWYGCFGASADSVRLTGQYGTSDEAKAKLDACIGAAGHLFAEYLQAVQERADRNEKRVAELELRLAEEEHGSSQLIDQRDRAEGMADKLAEHLAAGRDIGEHSSDNNPWQNALDLPDLVPTTPATSALVRRATDADTPVGDDRAPDRYMASGRETIDEVRDVCRYLARLWLGYRYSENDAQDKLGDSLFALHCLLTAYIYRSRAGRKGPAEQDHAKTDWYVQMTLHTLSTHMDEEGHRLSSAGRDYSDPRAKRPGFQLYGSPGVLPPVAWDDLSKALTPYEMGLLMMPITDRA